MHFWRKRGEVEGWAAGKEFAASEEASTTTPGYKGGWQHGEGLSAEEFGGEPAGKGSIERLLTLTAWTRPARSSSISGRRARRSTPSA